MSTVTEESTTIVKGKQTVYIRPHDSLSVFEWLGKCSRGQGMTQPLGEIEFTECQDPANPGKFLPDVEIEQSPGAPTGGIQMKKSIRNKIYEELYRCRWDVDIRYYDCDRLDDPLAWQAIDRVCNAKFTQYATDDETAYKSGDQGEVVITSPFTGLPMIVHIWRLTAAMKDTDLTTESILWVSVCEAAKCADACGPAQDCFLIAGTTALGQTPNLLVSDEGGDFWTLIPFDGTNDTPNWTNAITHGDCLGALYVVVSAGEGEVAWATDVDGIWTTVATDEEGVAFITHPPQAVAIFSPSNIYVVGEDGYIWKSTNGAVSFSTANGGDAGNATIQNLRMVKFISDKFVVAVGDANAIVRTENGGQTWIPITRPVAQTGVRINTVLALGKNRVVLFYDDGEIWSCEDFSATTTPTWVQDESVTEFAAIYAVDECGCGRVMITGVDADDDGLVYENVDSGAAGAWFKHNMPAGAIDTKLNGIACCDVNRWVVVGEAQYALATGAIIVLA